jgi:hypothetical protein
VKNCCQPNEEIVADLDELCRQKPDYWTLVIAKKKPDHDASPG